MSSEQWPATTAPVAPVDPSMPPLVDDPANLAVGNPAVGNLAVGNLAVGPEVDPAVDLEPPARRPRLPWATAGLALLVVGALGFLAGVQVEKRQLPASTTTAAATNRTTASTAAGGGAGGGRTGRGPTFGQVKVIDGTTLFVTDATGNTVKVTTAGASVTKSTEGTLQDVKPGDTVVVQGTPGADGTVAAQSITVGNVSAAAAGARRAGAGGTGGAGGGTRGSSTPPTSGP